VWRARNQNSSFWAWRSAHWRRDDGRACWFGDCRLHGMSPLLVARTRFTSVAQQPAQHRPRVQASPVIAGALRNDEEVPMAVSDPVDLDVPAAVVDGRDEAVGGQDREGVADQVSGAGIHAASPAATALIWAISHSVRSIPKRVM